MANDLDREICLCFHVTRRKIVNYLRVEKPTRVGQLSDCFGGDGVWLVPPLLKQLFDEAVSNGETVVNMPTAQEYARLRAQYRQERGDAS